MPGMPQWPCPLRSPRDAVCASGSAVARRTGGRFNGLGRSVERRVPVTGRHPSCHAGAHTSADPGAPARCPPGSRWREACRCRHGCAAMAIPPHRNRCPAPASHLAARQWRPVFMGAAWVAVCGMRLASVAWPAVPGGRLSASIFLNPRPIRRGHAPWCLHSGDSISMMLTTSTWPERSLPIGVRRFSQRVSSPSARCGSVAGRSWRLRGPVCCRMDGARGVPNPRGHAHRHAMRDTWHGCFRRRGLTDGCTLQRPWCRDPAGRRTLAACAGRRAGGARGMHCIQYVAP